MVQEEDLAEFQVHFAKLVPWIAAKANANTYSRRPEAQKKSDAPSTQSRDAGTSNLPRSNCCEGPHADGGTG